MMNKEKDKIEDLKIVIFRNNLRIQDNYPLYNALNTNDNPNQNIICIYPLEILEGQNFGFKSCGDFRREFIYESINELKQIFEEKNISFYCVKNIEETLFTLDKNWNLEIFYEKEVGVQEMIFEEKLEEYPCKSYFAQTLVEAFEIDITKSFSNFRNKVEKALKNGKMAIKTPLKVEIKRVSKKLEVQIKNEELELLNKELILKGGENSGIKRIDYYFSNFLHAYYDTRSLVDGFDNSSKLSVFLASGCVSPRTIYLKLKEYEEKTKESKSSYWIFFELLWRDFFHLVMLQSKNKLFLKTGLLENESYNFKTQSKEMSDFFKANTGVDIIDAGIIELVQTGWISNRLRQLLSSYFVKNLGLDFRYGAAFFQEYLLDYNCASNYGNWAYQAGVGNDKKYRVFDPVKQSSFYKGKDYVRKYLKKEESIPSFDYKQMALKVKEEIFKIKDQNEKEYF